MKTKKLYSEYTFREKSACGWVYLICICDGPKLVRVQIEMGKSGVCANSIMSGITDLINEMLYLKGKPKYIVKALEGHTCQKGSRGCCVNIVAKLINEWRSENENPKRD